GRVTKEGRDFRRCGWEAGQIEADAPQQGRSVGLGTKGKAGLFQRRFHEPIDGRPDAFRLLHGGNRRPLGRYKGPVLRVRPGRDEREASGETEEEQQAKRIAVHDRVLWVIVDDPLSSQAAHAIRGATKYAFRGP